MNWGDITMVLNTFKDNLQAKIENPAQPPTSYFAQVQEFIDIARNPLVEDINYLAMLILN